MRGGSSEEQASAICDDPTADDAGRGLSKSTLMQRKQAVVFFALSPCKNPLHNAA
jgi:hypothetical protein